MSETIDLNRRAVLRGGALVLGFTLLPRHALAEFNGMGVPPISNKDLAGSLQRTPMLDAWIRIAADGKVTVFTGKVELGTGVRTALLQVAAEQLDVAPAAINFITADTALTPNEGFTAAATPWPTVAPRCSTQRRRCALVLQGAAAQLKVDAAQLTTSNGIVSAADGRQLHYGEPCAASTCIRPRKPGRR
jgi:CO/xanthine dehydrogenase Mo-binding subunit